MPYGQGDEVLAATQLWLERAVIGLNLCPFAKAVHRKRQIRYAVTAAESAEDLLTELKRELVLLTQCDPSVVETTLLVHPLAMTDFIDYHFFLSRANAAVRGLGLEGVLQIAGFHPRYEFAGSLTEDIDNYTNRSPYPLLHLLREESLDRAVAAYPDSTQITDRNIQTLRRLGVVAWNRLWGRGEEPG